MAKSKTTDKTVKNDIVDSKAGKNSTALSKKPQDDKSEIARQIWIEEGYYRIVNSEDKEISAALKEIGKF